MFVSDSGLTVLNIGIRIDDSGVNVAKGFFSVQTLLSNEPFIMNKPPNFNPGRGMNDWHFFCRNSCSELYYNF